MQKWDSVRSGWYVVKERGNEAAVGARRDGMLLLVGTEGKGLPADEDELEKVGRWESNM